MCGSQTAVPVRMCVCMCVWVRERKSNRKKSFREPRSPDVNDSSAPSSHLINLISTSNSTPVLENATLAAIRFHGMIDNM